MTGLFLALSLATPAASAEIRYAAMVMDANSGDVLFEQYGDAPRHPASLTKMMTIYLAFEQIEQKRLDFASKIPVSERAAGVAPSKLELKPGEEIELLDALKALITKSANDVAVALAERIGGSEVGFVHLMNERAQQIGMRSTRYTNASGLPDPRQVTTARDMLTLALRMQDDFPQLYRLFALKEFEYRGKVYRTHNTLMRVFPGMDGIKTGYTKASGFNLVSSVRTGDKHLVAAVFGGVTANARNAHMRALLFHALEKASTKKTRGSEPRFMTASTGNLPPIIQERNAAAKSKTKDAQKAVTPPKPRLAVTKKPEPQPKPEPPPADTDEKAEAQPVAAPVTTSPRLDLQALRAAMSSEASETQASAPPASIEDLIVSSNGGGPASDPQPAAEPEDQIARLAREHVTSDSIGNAPPPGQSNDGARPASTLDRQAEVLVASTNPAQSTPDQSTSAPSAAAADEPAQRQRVAAAPVGSGFEIQIGAFATEAEAKRGLNGAISRSGGLLEGHTPVALPVQKGEHQVFRARFTQFHESTATNTCQQLIKISIDCFVMRSE